MNITSGRNGTEGWPGLTISKPKKLNVFRSRATKEKESSYHQHQSSLPVSPWKSPVALNTLVECIQSFLHRKEPPEHDGPLQREVSSLHALIAATPKHEAAERICLCLSSSIPTEDGDVWPRTCASRTDPRQPHRPAVPARPPHSMSVFILHSCGSQQQTATCTLRVQADICGRHEELPELGGSSRQLSTARCHPLGKLPWVTHSGASPGAPYTSSRPECVVACSNWAHAGSLLQRWLPHDPRQSP